MSTGNREARQGTDVVWMDDFELESLYYYYVGQTYFWEAPTEYPEFAVRYTPYHTGTVEGAWFYWYEGDATEVTLSFYADDAGYPGALLDTYTITPEFSGWYYYDLSSMGLAVNRMEDIYMSFQVTGGTYIQVISDDGSGSANRSYVHDGTDWWTIVDAEGGDYEWNMDLVVANTDVWANPSGEWNYIDTYSHSETHSWWIPEDPGLYLAALESPVFMLPDDYNQYFISEWVDIEFFRSSAGPGSIDETFRLWMRNADAPTPDYWQISDFNAYDGNSWWCGVEDAGFQGGWGYGNNWDQYIETPEIDLTSTGNISLDFMTRWDSEEDWDYGYVRISTNDFQTYDVLAEYTGTNNTWTPVNLDLTAYANQNVKLRFQFISDSNTSDEDNLDTEGAWFIDDVVISDDTRTIFFEDDADTNVNFLINPGNVAWDLMYYDYDRDYPNPSTGWELIDKDHIFNGSADVTDYAGGNVQIRFTITTDDSTYAQGAGCYVDDFEIVGSNMPPFDGACMFNVIPYPTTEGIDMSPGIVYGNLGQNPINPTLRMDIDGQGGPFDYTASNPGEIGSTEYGLGYLNPLPTTSLVEGNFDFIGTVIVGNDGNTANDNYTINIDVNAPGQYELGYNSRIWDGTYYTSSYSGTWFTPFSDGIFGREEFTLNSVKALMINYGEDNHIEVETIEIWEAIDDLTPGALIYSEDFDYTGAPPGEFHWAEFVLSEPQVLTEDFFITIGGEHTTNPDADYHILFDNMVRQYLGQGAYSIHTIYYDDDTQQWLHSSGDRFINAVGTVEMEETDPPENVAVDDMTGLVTWDPPSGGGGELYQLSQHDGNPLNGYYQSYDYGYGVVYDLSGFTNVTLETVDFRHSSWGVMGTWDYSIHIVDWDTYTELAETSVMQTTGDDQWEYDVPLGSISESGLVGIFMEPMGNSPTDAYPCLDGDDVLDGTSYYGDLSDYSAMTISTVGDFLMDLWIMADGTRMVQAPKLVANTDLNHVTRLESEVITQKAVTPNQKISMRDLESYNVYLDDVLQGNTTENEYLLEDLVSGDTYTAGVSAVYTEGESEVIEVEFTFIGELDPPENLTVDDGTGMLDWDPPGGAPGEYYELSQHANDPQNAYYQQYDYGYGVVFDVSGYSNVTVEMVDFRHSPWGIFGTWDYSFHIVDWDTYTEIAETSVMQTTGDDQWEVEIPLGSYPETGLVGIFLEPMSNDPTDAYPCMDGDNTLDGMSYFGDLSDYSAMSTADNVGDFLLDLWIMADGTLMKAPLAQPDRELEGYNVYLDGSMVGYTTDTEYQLMGLINGQSYLAGVSAVYTEGESDIVDISFVYSGEDTGNNLIPAITALTGNYPNPFNPLTAIQYQLKENSRVSLEIYNMRGQKVITLIDADQEAGYHEVIWQGVDQNGRDVSSGIYFYKMKAGRYTSTKKMILMK